MSKQTWSTNTFPEKPDFKTLNKPEFERLYQGNFKSEQKCAFDYFKNHNGPLSLYCSCPKCTFR